MKKLVKYFIGMVAGVTVIYFSIDVKNLEKYRATSNSVKFNASNVAARFWEVDLPVCISQAQQISDVLKMLNENPQAAFETYGKKLGISKTGYFLVKGKGTIESVQDEYIGLNLDNNQKIRVATDFIYGNAVRDGSGKVNIDDFLNMTDFNAISVEINKLVKDKVVSQLKKSASKAKMLEFAGAFEINEENVDLPAILVIPVSVKLTDGNTQ